MARATYSDEDRARVYVALTVNQGNVKRSARETQVPVSTVRLWKLDWEKEGGPSQEIVEAASALAEAFVEDAERIRGKSLLKFEQKVDQDEVSAKDLMISVGILSEKINMARGLANRQPSDQRTALDGEALREIARGAVVGALEAARKREAEIQGALSEQAEDAEFTPVPALQISQGD